MVIYAPGGAASLIMLNLRVAAFGKLRPLLASYLALAGAALTTIAGAAAIVEMVYHLQLDAALGAELAFAGTTLNVHAVDSWFGAAFVLAVGLTAFELIRHRVARQWGATQEAIEAEIKRREGIG